MSSASSGAAKFRIGVSLPLTGVLNGPELLQLRCVYCASAQNSLEFFINWVNGGNFRTQAGLKIEFEAVIKDDAFNITRCRQNYLEFVEGGPASNGTSEPPVDFLLGPGFADWNGLAVDIAENHGVPLILWAYDFWSYDTPIIPTMTRTSSEYDEIDAWHPAQVALFSDVYQGASARRVGQARSAAETIMFRDRGNPAQVMRSNEAKHINSKHRRRPSSSGLASSPSPRSGGHGPQLPSSRRLQTDDEAGRSGLNWTLNINVPEDQWAMDPLDNVWARGARRFLFAWFSDFPEAGKMEHQCSTYLKYISNDERFPEAWAYKFSLDYYGDFLTQLYVVRYLNPEVIFFCGRDYGFVMLTLSAKALNIVPSLVMVNRPVLARVVRSIKAFNANYFVEAMPFEPILRTRTCPVFQTFGLFMSQYEATYGSSWTPATLQVAGAGALLVVALLKAASTAGAAVVTQLKESATEIFLGRFQFGATGNRRNGATSLRQLFPVPQSMAGDHSEIRFARSLLVLANEEASLDCDGDPECTALYVPDVHYPSPDWIDKELDTYPCNDGCLFVNLACVPCPLGKYRFTADLTCRRCPPETYTAVPGSAYCTPCPRGANCPNASTEPRPRKGFYTMAIKPTKYTGNETASFGKTACNKDGHIESSIEYAFVPCQPQSVCLGHNQGCVGSNEGTLCGQCRPGHTYQRMGLAHRRCERCPKTWEIVVRFVATLLMVMMMFRTLSQSALEASRDSHSLPCSLKRTMMHYLHLLGCVCESTHLEASTVFAPLWLPIHIVYKPIDLAMSFCVHSVVDSHETLRYMVEEALLMMPLGVLAIVFCRWLLWARSYAWLALRCFLALTKALDAKLEAYTKRVTSSRSAVGASSLGDWPHVWSTTRGSGLSFAVKQESIKLRIIAMDVCRECFVWVLVSFPWAVRGSFAAQACAWIGNHRRATANWDILCESQHHKELIWPVRHFTPIYLLGIPLALLAVLLAIRKRTLNVPVRLAFVQLYEGYREKWYFWEVFMYLHVGLMIRVSFGGTLIGRSVNMALVHAVFMIASFCARPFEMRDRKVLHYFWFGAVTAIAATIVVGVVASEDLFHIPQRSKTLLVASAILMNWSLICFGGCGILFSSLTQRLVAVIDAGSYTNITAYVIYVVARSLRGLSPVRLRNAHGELVNWLDFKSESCGSGAHFIDVSRLTEAERRFLVEVLSTTLKACIQTKTHFHAWLVENAISEAFVRATQARAAYLRASYNANGTTSHTLSWACRCLRASLRSPDIMPRQDDLAWTSSSATLRLCGCLVATFGSDSQTTWKWEHVFWTCRIFKALLRRCALRAPRTLSILASCCGRRHAASGFHQDVGSADNSNSLQGGSEIPRSDRSAATQDAVDETGKQEAMDAATATDIVAEVSSLGITVEELHDAMQSVIADILDGHPSLLRPPDVEDATAQLGSETTPQYETCTWEQQATVGVFLNELELRGTLHNEGLWNNRAVTFGEFMSPRSLRSTLQTSLPSGESPQPSPQTASTNGGIDTLADDECLSRCSSSPGCALDSDPQVLVSEMERETRSFKEECLLAQSDEELEATLNALEEQLRCLRSVEPRGDRKDCEVILAESSTLGVGGEPPPPLSTSGDANPALEVASDRMAQVRTVEAQLEILVALLDASEAIVQQPQAAADATKVEALGQFSGIPSAQPSVCLPAAD